MAPFLRHPMRFAAITLPRLAIPGRVCRGATAAAPLLSGCAGAGARRTATAAKRSTRKVAPIAEPAAAAHQIGAFRQQMRIDGVTLVTTPDAALHALSVLRLHKDRVHAWDTETTDLVVGSSRRSQSPVNSGRVVCATCFCGEDVDFGSGPRLFIDNFGPAADSLERYFKEYFEDESFKKVFHNYSFDRHMLRRHGIGLRGFHADTLHLARLYDTSLAGWEGSVQRQMDRSQADAVDDFAESAGRAPPSSAQPAPSPSSRFGVRLGGSTLDAKVWASASSVPSETGSQESQSPLLSSILAADEFRREQAKKKSTKKRAVGYGLKRLAEHLGIVDGHRSSFGEVFGVHDNAAADAIDSPESFPGFVRYSVEDAELTYRLFIKLESELKALPWFSHVHATDKKALLRSREIAEDLLKSKGRVKQVQHRTDFSLWTLVEKYMRGLGDCLADIEETGVRVDREQLREIQADMEQNIKESHHQFVELFKSCVGPDGKPICADAELLNPNSSKQLRTLLFGGTTSTRQDKDLRIEEEEELVAPRTAERAKTTFHLKTLGLAPKRGIKNTSKITGLPTVANAIIRDLAGDPAEGKKGTAYEQLLKLGYSEEMADRACRGLWHLGELGKLKRLLANNVMPLLSLSEVSGRLHPSWMFDTSTGRLVCRHPNLQNLPSAATDKFRIRSAMKPCDGNVFIIADYAQLELCVLAHLSGCASMVKKLSGGGDYHSEVAAEMFPEIREALTNGEVVMSKAGAKEGVPLVKERFSAERTQAKAINFGIIYGKTAVSLAEDLGITKTEAEDAMKRWFDGKPGVRAWIDSYSHEAHINGKVFSLLGRPRHLPLLAKRAPAQWRSRSLRATVNFGVQGSAADIVISAMLQIWQDSLIKSAGFKLVMQVHDEFVLEGPRDGAEQALSRLRDIMESPFAEQCPDFTFRVPLRVDAAITASLAEKP